MLFLSCWKGMHPLLQRERRLLWVRNKTDSLTNGEEGRLLLIKRGTSSSAVEGDSTGRRGGSYMLFSRRMSLSEQETNCRYQHLDCSPCNQ